MMISSEVLEVVLHENGINRTSAKMIIEKIGGYCILSIKKTNEQWEKLQ